MPGHDLLKTFNIFLASPSDLQVERKRAKQAVEFVNSASGRALDWHINLLGWEDTLPGVGRPQHLINEEVDRCHLFVGMLWQRWGEPPAAGGYTSGFEEEFKREP